MIAFWVCNSGQCGDPDYALLERVVENDPERTEPILQHKRQRRRQHQRHETSSTSLVVTAGNTSTINVLKIAHVSVQ
jgi:hypothetical protein